MSVDFFILNFFFFELTLSSDKWLSYKTLPKGKNLIMVRNAGSMCITKNILLRIVQYITVQPTYVCYCTLAPSPTT